MNLRDSFRRAIKKKRETKSGQAASKIKKWKFEDEMSFLLPFMQERNTCSNLKDISDEPNEDEPNEDENNDKIDKVDNRNDMDNNAEDNEIDNKEDDNENNDKNDDKNDHMNKESHAEDERKKRRKEINRKIITKMAKNKGNTQPETASAMVMKYLLNKKTAKAQITPSIQQPSAIDTFFSSIAATVKNFSPYYQNIAKSQIFSIISDLEMKQIMQEQPFVVSNTSVQHQHFSQMQSYHTGSYNVSRPSPSPSSSQSPLPSLSSSTLQTLFSPSTIASPTPTPSPSHYNFSATLPIQHLREDITYTENMNM